MLWVKSLETGIEKIDDQHKQLFEQLDILLDTENADRYVEVIDFLDEYLEGHCSDEQQLHKKAKYYKAEIHKQLHEEFLSAFRKMRDRYVKEGLTRENGTAIDKTLASWLRDHILIHDKAFSVYYNLTHI